MLVRCLRIQVYHATNVKDSYKYFEAYLFFAVQEFRQSAGLILLCWAPRCQQSNHGWWPRRLDLAQALTLTLSLLPLALTSH